MNLYIVGYDLKSGENYAPLIAALKAFGTKWHCLDSTWIIQTGMSELDLHKHLWKHMFSDDKLLVARYVTSSETGTGSAAWQGFDKTCDDWLQSRM